MHAPGISAWANHIGMLEKTCNLVLLVRVQVPWQLALRCEVRYLHEGLPLRFP